jgi:hypothetical protein
MVQVVNTTTLPLGDSHKANAQFSRKEEYFLRNLDIPFIDCLVCEERVIDAVNIVFLAVTKSDY